MTPRFLTLARWLARVQLLIAKAALVAMLLTICTDVFARAAFNQPIRGAYDAVGMLLGVATVYAFAAVIVERREIVIDLLDAMIPPAATGALKRLWGAVAALTMAGLVWSMIRPMLDAKAYGDVSLELSLPIWMLWAVMIAGMSGAALAALAAALMPPESHDAGRAKLEETPE